MIGEHLSVKTVKKFSFSLLQSNRFMVSGVYKICVYEKAWSMMILRSCLLEDIYFHEYAFTQGRFSLTLTAPFHVCNKFQIVF